MPENKMKHLHRNKNQPFLKPSVASRFLCFCRVNNKHNRVSGQVLILFAAVLLIAVQPANAADVVYRKSDSKRISGKITKMTNTEVVIKPSIEKKPAVTIPANDIQEIRWNGEPPDMMLLRAAERKESYDKALKGYEKILKQSGPSQKELKSDLSFLIARVKFQLAENEEKKIDEAIELLEKFRKGNSKHFRYYESLAILNRLYQKKDNSGKVQEISELIAQAPWQDFKDSGKIEKANALLDSGDTDQAENFFDEIIKDYGRDLGNDQLHKAWLGKAGCLIRKKKFQEAEKLVEQVLDHLSPEQSRIFAQAYLRQGELYRSSDRPKDAILAYLRIDLIFNKEKRAHEESLYWLANLWKQVGQETRSLKSSEKLNTKYPGSQWNSKLN